MQAVAGECAVPAPVRRLGRAPRPAKNLQRPRWRAGAVAAGALLAAGSLLTRFGVFEAGMASARDPKYTVVPQRERLAARENGHAPTISR